MKALSSRKNVVIATTVGLSCVVVILLFLLWPRGTVYPGGNAFRAQIQISQLLHSTHSFNSVPADSVKPIFKLENIRREFDISADVADNIERVLRQNDCQMWRAVPAQGRSGEGEQFVLVVQIGNKNGASAAMYKRIEAPEAP